MRIVFIGPPGSGKGTQCKRLVASLGLPQLSTGEMLRQVKGQETAVSRWVANHLASGELAPDHLVMRILANRLAEQDCQSGALLDGFPRTAIQAELLEEHLAQTGQQLDLVIELKAERQELVKRLTKRASIENRPEDAQQAIETRLKSYQTQTTPVVEFYKERNLLTSIDAMQTQDEVHEQIRGVVTRLNRAV